MTQHELEALTALRMAWPQWGWGYEGGQIMGDLPAYKATMTARRDGESWHATVSGAGYDGAGQGEDVIEAMLLASKMLRAALLAGR